MRQAAIRIRLTLSCVLVALAAPVPASAEMKHHYDCRVTGTSAVDHLGRDGQTAELTHFTCHITGGLLNGFVATGTNVLEPQKGGARLVGSIVVAQKAGSTVVYEVSEGTRRFKKNKGRVVGWESTGKGTFKTATGAAAALAGRSFSSFVRSGGPGAFSIEVVVGD
jgi:hypothetical protein